MKHFIYLMQGRSDLVSQYFHLAERENADALFLTYDKKIENAIFFPDSTWSEGRNKLLEHAKENGEYEYYIFCDDDIEFKTGSWEEFERLVLKNMPSVAVPVFNKTRPIRLKSLKKQIFNITDQQMIAFHLDLIKDAIIVPYQEQLDEEISWWASSAIADYLVQNLYRYSALQFNTIDVLNEVHGRYRRPDVTENYNNSKNWFAGELNGGFKSYLRRVEHNGLTILRLYIETLLVSLFKSKSPPDYRIKKSKLKKFFKQDSVLLNQYRKLNI